MKATKNLLILFFLMLSGSFYAQSEVEKWNKKTRETNEQVNKVDTTLQDTKATINNLTSTLGGLFGSKNTVIMAFSGIEFGHEDLSKVQKHLSEMTGVKDVVKHLEQGNVTIKMKTKKGPSLIWDNLPQDLKGRFKVVEANEKAMIIQYSKKPAIENASTAGVDGGRN